MAISVVKFIEMIDIKLGEYVVLYDISERGRMLSDHLGQGFCGMNDFQVGGVRGVVH